MMESWSVDIEVADIIRAAEQAARAEPLDRIRALDRRIEAIDMRLARIEGALAAAHKTGQVRVWYHPRGHWLVSRLQGVYARILGVRRELVRQRETWVDLARRGVE